MANIPDSLRGLDGLFNSLKRGTRDDPILVSRPLGIEAMQTANRREAARNLGRIFLKLRANDRRLSDWALPTARTAMDERVLAYQLDTPTQIVLGRDIELKTRIRMYDRYFDTVMPEVQKKAQEWGLKTLTEQSQLLGLLWLEIDDASFAAWMNKAAKEISRRSGICLDSRNKAEARKSGAASDPRDFNPADLRQQADRRKQIRALLDAAKNCTVAAAKSFVASDKIESAPEEYLQPQIPFARKLRYLQLLQILLAHPKITTILSAYFDSAAKGTAAAKQLIRESFDAVIEFRRSLASSPGSVWRYPPLIVGGIQELGLGEFAGFQDYALGVGAVIASKSPETLLNYIGMGLFAVALVSGVGTGAAILDLAIGGAGAYFAFVRERQQEQAMKASLFLPDKSKIATEFGYTDTSLALAFMLLAAISLVRPTKAAAKVHRLAQESEGTSPQIATERRSLSDARPRTSERGMRESSELPTESTRAAKIASAGPAKPERAVGRRATTVSPELGMNIEQRGVPLEPPRATTKIQEPWKQISELTNEAHPDWAARSRASSELPKTTRTETPLKSLGYDQPRPKEGYFTRAVPPIYTPFDYVRSLSQPELHHFWPQYLKGLPKQSLGELSGLAHDELHSSLIKWKDGMFNYQKIGPGPRPYELMDPDAIFRELRFFYEQADQGRWRDYLPNFDKAAEETLRNMGKWPPK